MANKAYITPAVETLDSHEILELLGPVQGYGPTGTPGTGGGAHAGIGSNGTGATGGVIPSL